MDRIQQLKKELKSLSDIKSGSLPKDNEFTEYTSFMIYRDKINGGNLHDKIERKENLHQIK